ncbi:MAG: hypothetical protein KDI92_15435 [Xanthomonadales bacterium]|nr:hypothetical protein [Xanthomonadales bacterium]
MEWQPENEIDPKLLRLIDPEQPLQQNDVFLPTVDFSVLELIWVVFWALVFSTGLLANLYGLIGSLQNSETAQLAIIIKALLAAACFYGAYKLWRSFYWKLYRRKLLTAGRYRHGMFILKDAILLYTRSQIFLIEKQWIRQLHIDYKGRGDSPELILILDKNGQQAHINLKILLLTYTAPELKKSLTEWMNSGVWKIG